MKELVCIVCPKGCRMKIHEDLTVEGHDCPRGETYGKNEASNPTRVITSTVKIKGAAYRRCPVKTAAPIPKAMIKDAMVLLNNVELISPVKTGDIVVENICGTNIAFVATRSL